MSEQQQESPKVSNLRLHNFLECSWGNYIFGVSIQSAIFSMIQAIFFDLGKVLADFNWKPAVGRIAESSVMTPGEVYAVCTNSALAMEYETGKITTKLFFERLKSEIGFSRSPGILQDLWSDIFTPIPKHVDLLDKLRTKYPVGLISNTNEAHVEWIREKFIFLQWFPKPTYSFVAGYLKPQQEIFQEALRALSVPAEKSLFIDDLGVNVLSAQTLGMKVIHLTTEKNLENELKQIGVDMDWTN